MIKNIKRALQALMFVPVLALGVSALDGGTVSAVAADCDPTKLSIEGGANCAQGENVSSDLFGETGIFKKVTDILLFLIGAISVIMLIIGGIRYVISGGDQAAVTAAKNTILYAIVGIVVAFLAFAAITFVTTSLGEGTA